MTIPYVAHEYQVPERYLYQSLRITDPKPLQYDALHTLAMRYIVHKVFIKSAALNSQLSGYGHRSYHLLGSPPYTCRRFEHYI